MMEARTTPRFDTGSILGVIGGALLALGSFLTWASVSVDGDRLAQSLGAALGVDPSQIPVGSIPNQSRSFNGIDGSDGMITLVAGIAIVALALLLALGPRVPRKPLAGLLIVGGLIGGGTALYDISRKDNAIADVTDQIAPSLEAAGIDIGILDEVFQVSLGIGIWMCAVGGAIAVIGGVVAFVGEGAPRAITASVGEVAAGMNVGTTPPPSSAAPVPAGEAAPATGAVRSDEPGDGGPPAP